MKLLKLIGLLTSIALLAACASTARDVPRLADVLRDMTEQNGRACIRTSDISGYGVRKGPVVSIDSMRKYYIATLHPGCFDLETSMHAMFSGDLFEVCGGRMDKVVTNGNVCTIDQVFEFADREMAFAAYDAALKKRQNLREGQ